MSETTERSFAAFAGDRQIATGPLEAVAAAAKGANERGAEGPVKIFDNRSGRRVDVDLSVPAEELKDRMRELARLYEAAGGEPVAGRRRGPGRPKLGVVAKEVTLLPRHWAWLASQRGGASATLRRLVDEARKTHECRDRVRRSQDAAYHFMTATLGNHPGYETALRALYSGDEERFLRASAAWPRDLAAHCRRLAAEAFSTETGEPGPQRRDSERA